MQGFVLLRDCDEEEACDRNGYIHRIQTRDQDEMGAKRVHLDQVQ